MKKQLYFDRHSGLTLSALAEDGKLVELRIEKENQKEIAGNIYKGRVVNVIESLNAAFVYCGLERNCFLPLSGGEFFVDAFKDDRQKTKDSAGGERLRLKEGEEIIVQVVKNPRGNKGAKVTTKLSFVGKNLIFLPGSDFLGISHKITEKELRDNLLFTADKLRGKGDGLIVRTVAPYATASLLREEVDYLRGLYQAMIKKSKTADVGEVLHREYDLPFRVMRDSFNDEIEKVIVGEKGLYEQLCSLSSLRPSFRFWSIEKYTKEEDMFSYYGIAQQVKQLSHSKVSLPNGASLVIEHTEAMTVIDVNTGKFLGNVDLENTVYATNIAAAREVARQVRLRGIGGIVVVDFIDMVDERHKTAVTKELEQCLSYDRAKCKVLPMNELCLVEFTRKRTAVDVAKNLLQPCPHCRLNGYILSNEFNVCFIRAAILKALSQGAQTVVVEMNRGVMQFLIANKMMQDDLKRWQDREIYLTPHRTYHEEDFSVVWAKKGEKITVPEDAVLL